MKTNITKDERQKMLASLKFGDIAAIARLSGKSRSTIKRWFKNKGGGLEIPEAINNLLKTRQKTIEGFRSSLKSIGN